MADQSDMNGGGNKINVANPHDKLFKEIFGDKTAAV